MRTRLILTVILLIGINALCEIGQDMFQVSVSNVAAVNQVEDSDEAFVLASNISGFAGWINTLRYSIMFLIITLIWMKPAQVAIKKAKANISAIE